jgi:hypothetical protein
MKWHRRDGAIDAMACYELKYCGGKMSDVLLLNNLGSSRECDSLKGGTDNGGTRTGRRL